jgi:YfiH family protein
MKQVQMNGLHLWQFENLGAESRIQHFVTGRNSLTSGNGFTLSFSSHPDRDVVVKNRSLLATAMGIKESNLYFPSQVHKTRIVRVTANTKKDEVMDTDALITNEGGICIAVMSADCVPILLYDKRNNAIGAVHSGWRGTVEMILTKTLNEMKSAFGTKGEDLVVGIGPSVCQDSYEVGEEVVEEVSRAFGKNSALMVPQANKKAKLDLWSANKIQLLVFGVPSAQIEMSNLCTVKNNDHFFSARKGDAGRFGAGILML